MMSASVLPSWHLYIPNQTTDYNYKEYTSLTAHITVQRSNHVPCVLNNTTLQQYNSHTHTTQTHSVLYCLLQQSVDVLGVQSWHTMMCMGRRWSRKLIHERRLLMRRWCNPSGCLHLATISLPFHTHVLHPDLDVSFGQVQSLCQLGTLIPVDVEASVELLLNLRPLKLRKTDPCLFSINPATNLNSLHPRVGDKFLITLLRLLKSCHVDGCRLAHVTANRRSQAVSYTHLTLPTIYSV